METILKVRTAVLIVAIVLAAIGAFREQHSVASAPVPVAAATAPSDGGAVAPSDP